MNEWMMFDSLGESEDDSITKKKRVSWSYHITNDDSDEYLKGNTMNKIKIKSWVNENRKISFGKLYSWVR